MVSYVSIVYAAANWILDPLFINGAFGFAGFGIAGAAYATLSGWAIGIVMALWLLRQTDLPIHPALIRECRAGKSSRAIIKVAMPAAFSNAINPIGLSVLTALLAGQGDAAVAGFGAAGRLQSFAVVPLLGLSGSIGAIVGQNWGAGRHDRARTAMFEAGRFCVIYGLGVAVILSLFGGWCAEIFTNDPAVIAEFSSYLMISVWGYAGFGLLITANGVLNAVDMAGTALLQSCARVFLVMLPFAWIMRDFWGADGIYAAELLANLAGGALAMWIMWRVLRHDRAVDPAQTQSETAAIPPAE